MLVFRFLSSTSALAPHYLASVSSVPFSSCFCLTVASSGDPSAFASWFSPFFPAWFPVHSFPVPVLSVPVCFLLPYPDSLPQLFLRCLPSVFTSGIFRFPSAFFRPLRFHFRLLSTTVLPFRLFPASPHSGSSGAPFLLSLLRLSPLLPDWFPIRSFQVPVLGFLLVSFRSSLLRSRSCSTGDPLLNLFSGADA